jgi:nucleolar GTP-binding protein
LTQENQDKLNELLQEEGVAHCEMSNKSGEGIKQVKELACNLLLDYRLSDTVHNVPSNLLKREEEFLKGVYVAIPKNLRGDRPPVIPNNFSKLDRPTLKQIQEEMGGAGVFNFPLQEHYNLEDPDWKFDDIPEIMDGKNIADFIDRDILARLEELEREEEMLFLGRAIEDIDDEDDPDLLEAKAIINNKKALLKIDHKLKAKRAYEKSYDLGDVASLLQSEGKDPSKVVDRFKDRSKPKPLSRLYAEAEGVDEEDDDNELVDEGEEESKRTSRNEKRMDVKLRSMSRSRSQGFHKEYTEQEINMDKLKQKVQNKMRKEAKKGEADRAIPSLMPKHLFTGKRSNGKNDRR